MMKISRYVYDQMFQLPCVPPEIGGILGSKNEEIDELVFDITEPSYFNGIYVPNVSFLNKCIDKWLDEGITFRGMFHTHALNWLELSSDDKKYIIQIMNAMPDSITKLYFPVVFPLNFIRDFYAEKRDDQIIILEEELKIV